MLKRFQCTKIKDGLYIGNKKAASDQQFLLSNKLVFAINCTTELPNQFEKDGISYLQLKISNTKQQKLWSEEMKKIKRIEKFVEQAQNNADCCLFYCTNGNSRSLVMMLAYLMNRFKWVLQKSIDFVASKGITINLSPFFIEQLQLLEQMLAKQAKLSLHWSPPYIDDQDELLSKTYRNCNQQRWNSRQMEPERFIKQEQKRVSWQDKLDKQKKKLQKRNSFKEEEGKRKPMNEKNPVCNSRVNKLTTDSRTSNKESRGKPLSESVEMLEAFKKEKRDKSKPKRESFADQMRLTALQDAQFQRAQQGQRNQKSRGSTKLAYKEERNSNRASADDEMLSSEPYRFGTRVGFREKQKVFEDTSPNDSKEEDNFQQKIAKQPIIYKLTFNNFINPNINILSTPQLTQKPRQKPPVPYKFQKAYSQKQGFNKVPQDEEKKSRNCRDGSRQPRPMRKRDKMMYFQ